jgi:hypothetical protein
LFSRALIQTIGPTILNNQSQAKAGTTKSIEQYGTKPHMAGPSGMRNVKRPTIRFSPQKLVEVATARKRLNLAAFAVTRATIDVTVHK